MAITDHDRFDHVARLSRILQAEGLVAIPGEEVKVTGGGEILCYFINEAIAGHCPWEEVIDAVRAQDGIAVLAHPFDYLRGNWMARLPITLAGTRRLAPGSILDRVDGLETFNARNYSPGGNRLARDLATTTGKTGTGGSDAHALFELGCAWTRIDVTGTSIDEVHDAVRRGALVSCSREALPRWPVPGHATRRACAGVVKKTCSGLTSALPPFKRWRGQRDALPFDGD